MAKLLSLLYAPLFIVLMYNFEFKAVVLIYLFLSVIFFIYRYIKKTSLRDLILPLFYIVMLLSAYNFASFEIVKLVPVTLSAVFFVLFVDSTLNNKELIYTSTTKFYPKKLQDWEVDYLKKGDAYWAVVTMINTAIQIAVVYFASDYIWAFYTSVGWYIFFFSALFIQIIYGRFVWRKNFEN
ncbi:hypothetical protein FJR48_10865 [Sulfurimonas lithotrophica]|uniref:Intracellular septation protein A n=1 Tax=Sulfurimonas lithotrophica TaxID=2590022 RepID=A0A5P8P373_9BACT|nr:hypothetical protein [Sulfurimonas lithotrophica]QFR50203.1 hypothetical protein FJR48_10865 [Sulfurimonas lithotrophica]